MLGESVCFMLGLNKQLSAAVEIAVAPLFAKTRPLHRLDQSATNRLMTIGVGCVLVSEDALPNIVTTISNFFLSQRLWMPIIALSENPFSQPQVAKQTGAFACVAMPITAEELTNVVNQAFKCDATGRYSPATLREKMLQLTRREKQTIELFLQGNNTKVVAKSLKVTHQTVDKHRGRALRKLGMRTVVDLQNTLHYTMLRSIGLDLDPRLISQNEIGLDGSPINFPGTLLTTPLRSEDLRDAG